jgi:ribosomal protein S13
MSDNEAPITQNDEIPTLSEEEEALMRAMLEKSQAIGADQDNRLEKDILELVRMHIK